MKAATTGERYLDFGSGVAVNVLGHAHPVLVEALTDQAHKVWHVSNLVRIPEAERLAERLTRNEFTLEDLRDQLRQMKKLGPLKGILDMLPKMGPMKAMPAAAQASAKSAFSDRKP